ncbi:exodeoxyribonuclease V subunit gamma [Acinetobacter rudis]|uniref:RecBCD enzyme subunit RecC n=1 Tax=Acinetobacter rudis TaxID=632955 RepID=A0AAW8J7Z0_9GAMM|nr:exodeoxyribonuclease V subunit gamma [Acinetobacter rudis]MDQ8935279.1 exodeoxyribonuclease V subunit gamma [Acinetobacter rudis]MDQ9017526.1 exodeoxyribonuclease V subunit gamma [Acinetobacter rudis]
MGIHVIQSQRIDVLLNATVNMTTRSSRDVFTVFKAQHFVTPSAAVEQWLIQKISEHQGISANYQFHQSIRGLQWYAYQQLLEDKDKVRKSNIPRLIIKWRVFQILKPMIEPDVIDLDENHPAFSLIQRIYDSAALLDHGIEKQLKKQRMLYWIAQQVARLFSHYMVYRGHCQRSCPPGQCTCPSNWLQIWGKDQPLDIEKYFGLFDQQLSTFQLEQAQQLEQWQRWLWQQGFQQDLTDIEQIDQEFWHVLADQNQVKKALTQLPSQLIVFTLLELPPSQLNFLRRLGQYIDILILHYNPSQEYWADSVDPNWKKQYDLKVKQRFIDKHPQANDAEIAHFFQAFTMNFNAEVRESRHPLLTRFGKQARDHFSLLSHLSSGEEGKWIDAFVDEQPKHLLGQIQSDILYLAEPVAQCYSLAADDESIQLHVCHSTLRQLEVLKEQLSQWLAQSTLEQPRRPSDILVLLPNLADTEALIRHVFPHVPQANSVFIPVKIAGVVALDVQNAWYAVVGRIQISQGRLGFDEFAEWLALSANQIRYGLDIDMTERMLNLLSQAGFKRGLDEVQLSRHLPADDQDYRYSFKFALDRLVLGVAIPEQRIFADVLASTEVGRDDFELVSKLIEIYQDISSRRDWMILHELGQARSVDRWLRCLLQDINEYQQAGVEVLKVVAEIVQKQETMLTLASFYAGQEQSKLYQFQLPLPYLLDEIQSTLDMQVDQAVPTGQVTFCQLGQIRPLPYQLIVMLNLDSGTFPNRNQQIPFDLMQLLRPQLGDRSRLEDDQGAFLDALLLAQQQVWIFYNGFDMQDAEPRDPSSVVQELCQHLALICQPAETDVEDNQSIVKDELEIPTQIRQLYHIHSLQPFDPLGFQVEEQIRYQDHWFDLAKQLYTKETNAQRQSWVDTSLSIETMPVKVLQAKHWIQDILFPARLYLQCLGVENIATVDDLDQSEPLLLDGLGRYHIRAALQKQYLTQKDMAVLTDLDPALYQDQLPVGKVRQSAWQSSIEEQQALLLRLQAYATSPTVTTQVQWRMRPDLTINLSLPVHNVSDWVSLEASSARAKRRAQVWLSYLFWLNYLKLEDSKAQQLRRIVVFSDTTIICEGLTTTQAECYLAEWFKAYEYAQQQPLVLPAALLLQAAETEKTLTWTASETGWELQDFDRLLSSWRADAARFVSSFAPEQNEATMLHRDWQFILHEQDSCALLKDACDHYSYALYQPIYQYQYQVED